MNVGVVILNYLAYQVTIDTVNSFLDQEQTNVNVRYVIVDNGSENESFDALSNQYADNSAITVIRTKINLGFAGGNNLGYKELLKEFKPDIVIISNDDILLPQPNLYQWISDLWEKYRFAVLGPDVYSINGKFHQSPMEKHSQSIDDCKKELSQLKRSLLKCKIKKILHVRKRETVPTWNNSYYNEKHDDQTLHGSFMIFSSKYFEVFQEPFDSRTFLYHEEDIVRLRCDKRGLCCVYDPNYQVHHLQAVSTKMAAKNGFQRDIARLSHLIASMKVYMKVIEEEEGDGSESGKEQKLSKKTSR